MHFFNEEDDMYRIKVFAVSNTTQIHTTTTEF